MPGKPRVFMPYVDGFSTYEKICNDIAAEGLPGFHLRPGRRLLPHEVLSLPTVGMRSRSISDGLSRILETHVAPWMRCNMWLVHGRNLDLLIDSGMGLRPLKAEIAATA